MRTDGGLGPFVTCRGWLSKALSLAILDDGLGPCGLGGPWEYMYTHGGGGPHKRATRRRRTLTVLRPTPDV